MGQIGNVGGVDSTYSQFYAASTKSNSNLGLDDFLYLLAAQLGNQDMMNPMSDTEFISQLAQFSSLEAMQQLNQMSSMSYASGLLGKEVTIARVQNDGSLGVITGTVTGVGLFNNDPVVYIDGGTVEFYLSEVMVVGAMPETPEEEDPDGDGDGGDDDGGVTEPDGPQEPGGEG